MKVDEIRDRFLRFFEKRDHAIYPSDSLVPANDSTLLFTGAGMNQFKEEFLGRVRGSKRAATCQKCLRTGDLENVGKTPNHHTFFEMLGNFSFGDYFKKEAIVWAWEFLKEDLGLKEGDLWVSVYQDDSEAYDIWKNIVKLPQERILKLGAKENFWPSNAPADGPNGPCGPCSEIFYGGPDGVEVWNLVFTQFDRREGGALDPLPNKNIDTGMGLERIARVMQGKKTNFEIDSFRPIIDTIKELASRPNVQKNINAIADHIRAVTFAIADGVLPSNEDRGYVIRKLIRKAFWYGRSLGLQGPFLYKIVPVVAKVMKKVYPELTGQREDIAQVVLAEEKRFTNTIQEGLERLETMMDNSKSSGVLSGIDVFKLYDTYGFPVELTQAIARNKKIDVDIKGFERCMKEQRVKSKEKSKIKGSIFEVKGDTKLRLPEETIFIEDKEEMETEVLQITGNAIFLKETNFYGEKGGQVGDSGWLIRDGKVVADVINAIDVAGRVQHEIKAKEKGLKIGDKVIAKIDIDRREKIKKNHTATHLLHNALRKVLGQHVKQSGSLVAPDRLRFDFRHFKALTEEELSRIEEIVNGYIKKNNCIETKEMAFNEAKREGAIALFGEKYGDRVRLVSVGGYSKELCGGMHVRETGEINIFKIISEGSIASGVRRIEAVTWERANKKIKEQEDLIRQIAIELKTSPEGILKAIENMTQRLKGLEKELEDIGTKTVELSINSVVENKKEIKGNHIIIDEIKNADMDLLRKAADIIKSRLKEGVFVLVSEKGNKTSMIVSVSLKDANLSAIKILNDTGSSFGIKGGGRPDFAQAGGRSNVDIGKILKKAEDVIKGYL
ncbi:alanine--tRNA ligase [Candidatus Omnitrophota bacterium]